MQNYLFNTNNSSVYPGAYVPVFNENELNTLNHSCKNETKSLSVNITELAGSCKIEFSIPGVKRENFTIESL